MTDYCSETFRHCFLTSVGWTVVLWLTRCRNSCVLCCSGDATDLIRFPLMSMEEFASCAQTKILQDREIVNLFLYFTVNPKPNIDFFDKPRCYLSGVEYTLNRFRQVDCRWGYSGTPDKIRSVCRSSSELYTIHDFLLF